MLTHILKVVMLGFSEVNDSIEQENADPIARGRKAGTWW